MKSYVMNKLLRMLDGVDYRRVDVVVGFENWKPPNRSIGVRDCNGSYEICVFTVATGDTATRDSMIRAVVSAVEDKFEVLAIDGSMIHIQERNNAVIEENQDAGSKGGSDSGHGGISDRK